MACDSGGEIEMPPQEAMAAVADLDDVLELQHRRPLHLDVDAGVVERTVPVVVPSDGATVLGAVLPRHAPPQLGAVVATDVFLLRRGTHVFEDLNLIQMRGQDVNQICAIETTPPICFLIHTPSTQEQRTVWLLLNNSTRIFQGNTSGTMHIEACQKMCFNFNSTQIIACNSSSLQKYQATNKETGHWVLKDELDDFNTSYVCGSDASTGLVSCNFATQVAKIIRHCVIKKVYLLDIWGQLSQEQCYMNADFTLGDVRLLFSREIAPGMSTRVPIKWPIDILVEDFLTYLHDPKATSFLADKSIATGKIYYEDVSTKYSSTHCLSETVSLLCKIQLSHRNVVTSWRKHNLGWRSMSGLLKIAKFGDLNMKGIRGDDVNEIYTIESATPICFLIHTVGTQEQRTVWLQLNNNTRIFQGDTSGTMLMEAFQNMCFNFNSKQILPWDSSSLQKYQVTNKESGHWVLKDELDDFNTSYVCYIGPDASTGLVSCNFATQVAKIIRHCVIKKGYRLDTWGQLSQEQCYMVADLTLGDVRLLFLLEIAPGMCTRVPIKWPIDTLVCLRTYLHDLKAASFLADKTIATCKVYYGDVSTKYSSSHYPCETWALLCKIQLSHRVVVASWRKHNLGWRGLSRLLKIAKGSGEGTRRAETIRNFRKEAHGRPCNCDGSSASQEMPPWLLRLASCPHGPVECSSLLHLKGSPKQFNLGDINTAERRGNDDVHETNYDLESSSLIWLLIHTPSTQEQRTMWLLLNDITRIFQRNTRGIMDMEAFQDMCLNLNSTNIVPSYWQL